MNLRLMFFASILDSLLIPKNNNKFHLFKLLISCCQDQLLWDRQQIMLKAVLWSDNLYRGLQKPIYYVVLGFNPFFTKTIQNGSQTIRARKTRLWRFGLLICGWGLRFWGWGFRILGLGQVLGTNSHGFIQNSFAFSGFMTSGSKIIIIQLGFDISHKISSGNFYIVIVLQIFSYSQLPLNLTFETDYAKFRNSLNAKFSLWLNSGDVIFKQYICKCSAWCILNCKKFYIKEEFYYSLVTHEG